MAATTVFDRPHPPLPSSPGFISLSPTVNTCPRCNAPLPLTLPSEEEQRRIVELEAQVKLLNSKAAAAVDKLADYEDEVRFLRAIHARSQQGANASSPPPDHLPHPPTPQPAQSRLSSLSAFLPGRRNGPSTPSTANFPSPPVPPIPPAHRQFSDTSIPNSDVQPENDMQLLLQHERAARQSAEQSLNAAHSELEELTAQLFGQANEMVATERKARVKLEDRVKVLEKRDGEKRRRLERLERAIERIERVRELVRS